MTTESELKRERVREILRMDYKKEYGEPFKYFYCPILHADEETQLCLGHIVNDCIPNSSKRTTLQRKDVDGFYGTLLETHFATIVKANKPSIPDILFDPELRRGIPWSVNVDGKTVPHYEPKKGQPTKHPVVKLQNASGEVLKIALKASDEELTAAGGLQIVVERSYVPESTASLLKAAHLTMFRIFGYRHVFSPGGTMAAEILRSFYLTNRGLGRKEQAEAAKAYFPKYAGMIIPLGVYDKSLLRGSIDDHRFVRCIGSSGSWYAFGVFVRTDEILHVVFLAPDEAEHMDTYLAFVRNMEKDKFVFQFMDFVASDKDRGPHWVFYQKEYTFDPNLPEATQGT